MCDVNYSREAENILALFYEADFIVYVEGDDDVCFWDIMLNKFSSLRYEVIEVGGCNNLEPYISKVLDNSINDLVALDLDFNKISGSKVSHNKILYTHGYSIENTYITIESIQKTIKHLGRLNTKIIQSLDVESWHMNFIETMKDLIELDIFNHLNQKGEVIISDSIHPFLASKDEILPDTIKVNGKKESISQSIGYCGELSDLVSQYPLYCLLKGHFIFSGVANYIRIAIRSFGKKVSIPDDSIYSNLISNFTSIFNDENPEYQYYKDIIEKSYN